jgi:hypothetical protein
MGWRFALHRSTPRVQQWTVPASIWLPLATAHRKHCNALSESISSVIDLVFVGIAAGRYSAEVGAYYARSGNRFWKMLHDVRITSRLYEARECFDLLTVEIGFTDMFKKQRRQRSRV